MYPLLFEIFGVKIYSYGVLVALAFVAGFALIAMRAKKAGDRVDDYLEAIIWFIVAGIGGARLFYFIWFPEAFFRDPIGSLLSKGGLVWYGGVIGAFIASVIYTRIKRINLNHFGDIVAPAAALGLAIGRIGCLLAGCCYGAPCDLPWAIRYPHTHETMGLPVHPAPLYETALMLLVMGLLIKLDKNKPFEGYTLWWFVILAGVVRFALEFIRGDQLVWSQDLHISASQWVSVGGILLGTLMLGFLSKKSRMAKDTQGTSSGVTV
jgi:phosphatidylglycerol:prolipoprotein diacylglycerol transferase